jgi:hypothetical protein
MMCGNRASKNMQLWHSHALSNVKQHGGYMNNKKDLTYPEFDPMTTYV